MSLWQRPSSSPGPFLASPLNAAAPVSPVEAYYRNVQVPRWLIRLFPPSQAYMRQDDSRPFGSPGHPRDRRLSAQHHKNGGFVTATGITSASSKKLAATQAERATAIQERLTERELLVRQVHDRFGEVLLERAACLAKFGFVQLRTTAGTVDGRLVRFRFGHCVLELFPHAADGHIIGSSKTELTRSEVSDLDVLAEYLTRSVAHLGHGAEVLP